MRLSRNVRTEDIDAYAIRTSILTERKGMRGIRADFQQELSRWYHGAIALGYCLGVSGILQDACPARRLCLLVS